MKSITKIYITITASLVIFSIFVFLSFSGGFQFIENNFFSKRIGQQTLQTLSSSIELLKETHTNNIKGLQETLKEDFVLNIFDSRFTNSNIIARDKYFTTLNMDIPGFDSIRIITKDGKKIEFSTIPRDIKSQTDTKRIYNNLNQVEEKEFFKLVQLKKDEKFKIIYLEKTNQFLYILPFYDKYDQYKGYALFYVSCSGFRYNLAKAGFISSTEEAFIVNSGGVLLNLTRSQFDLIKEDVNKLWNKQSPLSEIYISKSDSTSYVLFTVVLEGVGLIGKVVDAKSLELSPYMKEPKLPLVDA